MQEEVAQTSQPDLGAHVGKEGGFLQTQLTPMPCPSSGWGWGGEEWSWGDS